MQDKKKIRNRLFFSRANADLEKRVKNVYIRGDAAILPCRVTAYDDVNARWTQVIGKLENVNNPIASEILKTIISIADVKAEGVIDSNGIAANGFFGFFKKIIEWFKWLFDSIKNFFK